jgi:predicted CoA-binding protein
MSTGTFPSLSAVPHALDCVDLIISPKLGLKVVEEAHSLGIKHVFIQPGARSKLCLHILNCVLDNPNQIMLACLVLCASFRGE